MTFGLTTEDVAVTPSLPPLLPPTPFAFPTGGPRHTAAPVRTSVTLTTVTVTDDRIVPKASVTESSNVRAWGGAPIGMTAGAVKRGVSVSASASATSGPAVCVHEMVGRPAFGLCFRTPASTTPAPEPTVKLEPALT